MAAPIGNKHAAKAKEWEQSLKRAMARQADGDFRKTLDQIAEIVVNAALAGEKDAWREIADRLDGKPAQSTDLTINDRRSAADLTNDELASIAAGGGEGTAGEATGAGEPAQVH